MIDFFRRHARRPRRHGGARRRGVRRRADPARAAARSAGATSSRSTSRSSSTRSCTCSARWPSSTAGCRSGGRSRRWCSARRSPSPCLLVVAQAGVDYGLPGQVAMRASLGYWGARLLSSPYRVVAAMLLVRRAGAGRRARLPGGDPGASPASRLRSSRSRSGSQWSMRCSRCSASTSCAGCCGSCCPFSLVLTAVLLVALPRDRTTPRFATGRVFDSPDQHLTWVGFATFVTVTCGASLTLVTSIADFCRYTPTRRDMRIGSSARPCSRAADRRPSSAATRRRPPATRTRSSPSPS